MREGRKHVDGLRAVDTVQQRICDDLDVRPKRLDPANRERLRHERPQAGMVRRIEIVDAAGDVCERGAITELCATCFAVEGCPETLVPKRSDNIVVTSQDPSEWATVDRVFLA